MSVIIVGVSGLGAIYDDLHDEDMALLREDNMIKSRAMAEEYRVKVGSRGSAKIPCPTTPFVMPSNCVISGKGYKATEFRRPIVMHDNPGHEFSFPALFDWDYDRTMHLDGHVEFGEPFEYKPLKRLPKYRDPVAVFFRSCIGPRKLSLGHWTEYPFKDEFKPEEANDFNPLNIEAYREKVDRIIHIKGVPFSIEVTE